MLNSTKPGLDDLVKRTATTVLNPLALIEVRGDEAESFLQGQLSNDIAALGDAVNHGGALPGQLHAYCNPKGRVLAVIRLVRYADGFWMLVPAGLVDGLVARLKMYVLRAKVSIELRPDMVLLGLIHGDDAKADDGIARIPLDGMVPRQILIGEKPAVDSFINASGYEPQPDDDRWRLADILSGIPQVYPQTVEAFIPQIINLDLVDGLSFAKGCYPGQEIVARLRYRGKVKQRMLAGVVTGMETLAPGDPIYADEQATQKAGMVVDAVKTADDEHTFSTTAPADESAQKTLRVGAPSGPALTRIDLPYSTSAE